MDDVDRRAICGEQPLDRLGGRGLRVFVIQRHRPLPVADGHGAPAVEPGERFLEKAGVPERGRHQEKARLRQGEERHLPGAAAFAVGVVVEFIHDDVLHPGGGALA